MRQTDRSLTTLRLLQLLLEEEMTFVEFQHRLLLEHQIDINVLREQFPKLSRRDQHALALCAQIQISLDAKQMYLFLGLEAGDYAPVDRNLLAVVQVWREFWGCMPSELPMEIQVEINNDP